MNMVIFSVYDSNFYSSAILITDLNAKKFKRVEANNDDFKDEIERIYVRQNPEKPFELFDYFEKLFDKRVDRILYLEDGGYVEDLIKTCAIIQEMSRDAIAVREVITDNKQRTVDTRIVIKPENRIVKFKLENER